MECGVAIRLAKQAGEAIMSFYGKPEIEHKADQSPLTQADLAANKLIVDGLRKHFPDHAILAEETDDDDSRLENEYCWIVDPLDGTKEFISENGEFTVNIALTYQSEPVLGVVYLPARDELFFADQKGAFHNQEPIQVSRRDRIEQMTLMRSRSHTSDRLRALLDILPFRQVVPAGSSLKGCRIAQGNADVYYRLGPTHEWDVCAMDAIVRAAGGKLTDLQGQMLRYNRKDTKIAGFIVSNGVLHDQLVEVLR